MKKVIRLTESDLTKVIKRIIMEQEKRVIKTKELIANGYTNLMGKPPLSSYKRTKKFDIGYSVVAQTESAAMTSLLQKLKLGNIDTTPSGGFMVQKKLSNGNIELKWISFK
jgi:hypothetical protein